MLHFVVATALQDGHHAHQIGVNISHWIVDGVAHAWLSSEMQDGIGTPSAKLVFNGRHVDRGRVGRIAVGNFADLLLGVTPEGRASRLVIADAGNDADWIALDLLSQAEHDASAQSILITTDGALGRADAPWRGLVALDGNLTEQLLGEIAASPLFAAADLRVAPASPGKAERLLPLLKHPKATLYVNLEEANLLTRGQSLTAAAAAEALLARGAARVLVTDGGRPCAEGTAGLGVIVDRPPPVMVARVTGAGDTFMAAHIVAERAVADRPTALARALAAAATYVSGDIGT